MWDAPSLPHRSALNKRSEEATHVSPTIVARRAFLCLVDMTTFRLVTGPRVWSQNSKLSFRSGVHPIRAHSAAFLQPFWEGGVGGVEEGEEKQVMCDWRLKYFINQCCSQCVVWWLVENSGNPSFLPATGIQDSPQVLHVCLYFFISRVNLCWRYLFVCVGVEGGSTLTLHLLLESVGRWQNVLHKSIHCPSRHTK